MALDMCFSPRQAKFPCYPGTCYPVTLVIQPTVLIEVLQVPALTALPSPPVVLPPGRLSVFFLRSRPTSRQVGERAGRLFVFGCVLVHAVSIALRRRSG